MKQSTLAAIRYGFGLGAGAGRQPVDAQGILDGLSGPDRMRRAFPVAGDATALDLLRRFAETARAMRQGEPDAEALHKRVRQELRRGHATLTRGLFARMLDSDTPMRERLVLFWLDHFTVRNTGLGPLLLTSGFMEDVIRTHMTGRFSDLLRAAVLHPQMLMYLDQSASAGPKSRFGNRQNVGLNENLAREVLELHTLGVDGAYTQTDVREFAELLTGLFMHPIRGPDFLPGRAEPGTETILGKVYGHPKRAQIEHIHEALDDLAVHPDTARHLARKLAVHFVSDTPDPDLVASIEAAWRTSGGDLTAAYGALLAHPAAWAPELVKVRQPIDYLASALRTLGVTGEAMISIAGPLWLEGIVFSMASMGQPLLAAPGPDGWPEEPEAWVTPMGLATRIRWSMEMPGRFLKPLPDPRDFVKTALDDAASPELIWAAGASETVAQGVGLVLASPEFNRR